MWRFTAPPEVAKLLVTKGSVTVDGTSLTVVEAGADYFTVALIPKTVAVTTFQFRRVGDLVNIETDILGKYVYRFLHPEEVSAAPPPPSIVMDLFQEKLGS